MKKITKIFASVFTLLLVCVGVIGLVGCKDKEEKSSIPNNVAYGQEFTVLTKSVKHCEGTHVSGQVIISVDLQVGIFNTTNKDYNLNHEALVLMWDDNTFMINGKSYVQFSTNTEEYSVILPNSIKNANWTNGMKFVHVWNSAWTNTPLQQTAVINKLKDINFTLKYNNIQVATFNLDVSNITFA